MNSLRLICTVLLLVGYERTAQSSSQAGMASSIASPTATARCWIYHEIYPVTEAAYKSQHVTRVERKEIEKWALPASPSQERLVRAQSPWTTPPSASEHHLVRWMRDPNRPGAVFVFVALNANVVIDARQCSIRAYPTA